MPDTQLEIVRSAISHLTRLKETFEDDSRVVPYNPEVLELSEYYERRARELAESLYNLYEKLEAKGRTKETLDADELSEAVHDLYCSSMFLHHLSEVVTTYMVKGATKDSG